MSLTITATCKPLREPLPKHEYSCGRCGIIREKSGGKQNTGYCRDCQPEARKLGWADPHWTQKISTQPTTSAAA